MTNGFWSLIQQLIWQQRVVFFRLSTLTQWASTDAVARRQDGKVHDGQSTGQVGEDRVNLKVEATFLRSCRHGLSFSHN